MLAYSPEVPAATIMADTNDDLVSFLRRSFVLSASPFRYPPFHDNLFSLSVTLSGNASTTNTTSYADYNYSPAYTYLIYINLRYIFNATFGNVTSYYYAYF